MATTSFSSFSLPYAPNSASTQKSNGMEDAFQVLKKEKDPVVGVAISDLFGLFNKLKGSSSGSTDEFAAKASANMPVQDQQTTEENNVVGDYFNGAVQKKLDSLRELRKAAVTSAAQRSLSSAGRDLNLLRLGMPTGAAPAGNSSYMDKLAMDKQAEINIGAALDDVNQQSSDNKYLSQLQLSLRGMRQSALDEAAKRGLLPAAAETENDSRLTALLQALSGLQLNNNFYGLGTARGALGA